MVAGTRFCPACVRDVPAFAPGPGGRPNARCPLCQALERHRFLAYLLSSMGPLVSSARALLDVAPQSQIRQVLLDLLDEHRYVGVDLFPERDIDAQADMTRLPFRDAAFDVVICYHVFEHIPDDAAAMREVARVMSPGALALVQVPRKFGVRTHEDPSASPEERARRFGQADHVRWYGDDFETRLIAGGLKPYRIRPSDVLQPSQVERIGASDLEPVWICRTTAHDEHFGRPPWPGDGPIELPRSARMPGSGRAERVARRPLYRRVGGKVKRLVR